MPVKDYLEILHSGVKEWNQWRRENFNLTPSLAGTNLCRANLAGVDFSNVNLDGSIFSGANLSKADFSRADLFRVNFSKTNLSEANFDEATLFEGNLIEANLCRASLHRANLLNSNFSSANLSYADLSHANLSKTNLSNAKMINARLIVANLSGANLFSANLEGANISGATLVNTNFTQAKLQGCRIYGISVWKTILKNAHQEDLIITPSGESPIITVDNLEVAQFIYLLLNNEKIREVIDTISSKVVLILGRFTPERKIILDTIRDELRNHNYLPVMFDFEKPANRDIIETVSILAHMSRFVVADITDARTVTGELMRFVPLLKVPVQPLLQLKADKFAWTGNLEGYPWFLPTKNYEDLDDLKGSFYTKVIESAEHYLKH